MAKKDIITTVGGAKHECVNTSQPVGKHLTNLKEDVMLVQAMLEKLAERASPDFIGLSSFDQVPEPTGNFDDGLTEKAIWSYQRKHAGKLLRVDGVVHPAAYHDRSLFSNGDRRVMTITQLHFDLVDQFLISTGDDNYIPEITRTVPELRQWIK